MIDLRLRSVAESDSEFLYSVYAATRADEINAFGWDASQANAFLKMQFEMRKRSYALQYPSAVTYIIVFNREPAGSMIVDRNKEHTSLTDIAVLPEFRGKGIASRLIADLQREAGVAGVPLTLHVDKGNQNAFRLYESLGFVVTNENELYYSMMWKA
ncbi:MAG TPA: GNAT family N-acetyltransferase [Pyrinomonadaceae bacterium]|nr:GNAT family N-acetyltransferase [Pyrinomonadaceae bacterium]